MNFIVGLPRTQANHNAICVSVDRLTEFAHFIPINEKYTLEILVKIHMDEVVSKREVLVSIVSYRYARFTSKFWQAFQEYFGTKLNLSTEYHL